ncbi:MAG: hypothetical protein PHQ47_01070 [Candidatus Portnoybacteria bacterium]|nr:hypothetical protein [Candidatus Portnoybacteria bacterium]
MEAIFDYFYELYDYLAVYFSSPSFQRTVLILKLFSFVVSALLMFAIIILLSRAKAGWWVKERLDSFKKPNLPQKFEQKWNQIKIRIETGDETNLKMAVIEADSMLDEILKRMSLPGKDMGERLEQISKNHLPSIDDVWEAHRLRNTIVHNPDIGISHKEAEKSIEAYEKALKELEAL